MGTANPLAIPMGGVNPRNNLFSLLQTANRAGLVSEAEVQNIQVKILDLLKDVIISFTSNQSSSVTEETAQNLLRSIIYCLDFYCMKMDDQPTLIQTLQSADIKDIYKEGLELLGLYVEETKKLCRRVKAEKLATGLIAYNTTIDKAIPDFFSGYDIRFQAHDSTADIDIDYPLMFDDMNIKGILYIRQYLEKLSLENAFCRLFTPKDIEYLLKSYGRTYHIRYEDYLLNICEIVLTNAICSKMLDNPASKIIISPAEGSMLKGDLNRAAPEELPSIIKRAANKMIAELSITEPAIIDYVHRYEAELLARLKSALQHDTLSKLVITTAVSNTPEMTFDPGKKMDNHRFRLLVQRVLNCTEPSEKAGIIMTNITSVTDFIDILKADCLFDDEYLTLFEQLGDLEISVLLRIVFCEELRAAGSLEDAVAGLSKGYIDWKDQLIMFLQNISPYRLKTIAALIESQESGQ